MYIYPYVYICTHKTTNKFYIGVRYANKHPSKEDLGIRYFTSSKEVKQNFQNYNFEIIAEFFQKEDALNFEYNLITENFRNPLCINKAVFPKFRPTPNTKEKLGEEKYLQWIKKLSEAKKGVKKTKVHIENQSKVRLDKKRGNYNKRTDSYCSCICCKMTLANYQLKRHFEAKHC